eukprot:TRINITY_DN14636_c0_g1_i1.p1 TRINITY_DN14636_c0_g1~~TRINITY_DN14636_c0_g1_i1.p1  ORF type:complete len:370 (-),score=61.97 TRINITY_DN14636_c0_g1_i1:6-1115(-)
MSTGWLLTSVLVSGVWSCSYVEIPFSSAGGTSYMIARSMELSNVLGITTYDIQVVPPRKQESEKYGYVAPMSIFKLPLNQNITIPADGMNEKGLTVSALILAESIYEDPEEGIPSVKAEDVIHNLLTGCDSVDSALAYLASVRVVKSLLAETFPCHMAMADASGRSVVVEFMQGKRVVHENVPRVLTNDPPLEWHWRNLNTFTNLNPSFPNQNDFMQVKTDEVGTVPRTIGHGWNLHGLPGDTSPPSRFVRLFYLRGYALHAQKRVDSADAVVLGTALLNNVFIPYGTVAPDPSKVIDNPEYTPYGIIKSPAERKMLFRGYRNSRWRQLDISKLDFSKAQTWPLEDGSLGIDDLTSSGQLKAAVEPSVV